MATEQHKQTAQEYFKNNPTEHVVHISSDGQVFFQKNYNDAVNHQRRIDEKVKLVSVYRKEKIQPPPAPPEAGGEDAGLPTEKWKKDEIAEWLEVAGVELTGKETKAELLEKVNEVQAAEPPPTPRGTGGEDEEGETNED